MAKAAFELKSAKRQVFELPPSHLAKGLRIEACAGGDSGDIQEGIGEVTLAAAHRPPCSGKRC